MLPADRPQRFHFSCREFPLDFDAGLPSVWFGAPRSIALAARDEAYRRQLIPHTFRGRAGLLCSAPRESAARGASVDVRLMLEPFVEPPLANDDPLSLPLPKADSLVGISPETMFEPLARTIRFLTGSGESFSLFSLAEKLREGKPKKIARGGGAGLNLTHEHWNKALLDAVRSPFVANLADLNFERRHLRESGVSEALLPCPVAALEWWCGETPAFDVKFDGMPLSPRTTTKPLAERLLQGYAVCPDPRFTEPKWTEKRPAIIMDGPDWVVIDKPSGLLSVPGAMGLPDAMTMTAEMTGSTLTPVHRLDMDTSGLLVYSKNIEATKALMADFREGRIEKRYHALVRGVPQTVEGEIRFPLTTNPLDRLRQIAALGGRDSVTTWRLLKTIERPDLHDGSMGLLELTPVTGRTHQLRVHCAHKLGLGMPILGDPYYGPEGLCAETPETPLALHAAELQFTDPKSGARMYFEILAPFEEEAFRR